jgi:hypothetical protein
MERIYQKERAFSVKEEALSYYLNVIFANFPFVRKKLQIDSAPDVLMLPACLH